MTAPTVWAKAKAEIQRRGWHQGGFYKRGQPKDSAPVCIAGAVCAAVAGDPTNELHHIADHYLTTLGDHLQCQVAQWNDVPGRTIAEVYALLDELDAAEREAPHAS